MSRGTHHRMGTPWTCFQTQPTSGGGGRTRRCLSRTLPFIYLGLATLGVRAVWRQTGGEDVHVDEDTHTAGSHVFHLREARAAGEYGEPRDLHALSFAMAHIERSDPVPQLKTGTHSNGRQILQPVQLGQQENIDTQAQEGVAKKPDTETENESAVVAHGEGEGRVPVSNVDAAMVPGHMVAPVEFVLTPRHAQDPKILTALAPNSHYHVIVLVVTHPSQFDVRAAIRKEYRRSFPIGCNKSDWRVANLFVMGPRYISGGDVDKKELAKEVVTHGDILLLDHEEDYHRFTFKVLKMFSFVVGRQTAINTTATWVAKVDSDVYLNYRRMASVLHHLPRPHRDGWVGLKLVDQKRKTYGKWKDKVFTGDTYPPYMHGPFYVLGWNMVTAIISRWSAGGLKVYPNEDTAIGLWLENENKITHDLGEALFVDQKWTRPVAVPDCVRLPVVVHHGSTELGRYEKLRQHLHCSQEERDRIEQQKQKVLVQLDCPVQH
eukprot:comp22198_c0_seq1/m.32637 comp22198_c0_seq1/g.32637  ORF comp22198_c0_seq1/g.32637 comp22198_c0_seq1/m.32637 type:complete len:491 (-) comp22198_c0_seq1:54-1526(-)